MILRRAEEVTGQIARDALERAVAQIRGVSGPGYVWSDLEQTAERVFFGFSESFFAAEAGLEILTRSRSVTEIESLLARWQSEGGPPVSVLIAAYLARRRGILNDGIPAARAAMAAGLLADVPNANPYHGNAHFREVVALSIALLSGEETIGPFEAALQLISAAGHDLFHDGRDNRVGGVHIPFHLESRAFEALSPVLVACGVPEAERSEIRTLILCTDVSRGPEMPVSPHRLLQAAYDFHFTGAVGRPDLPRQMAPLLGSRGPALCRIGVRLQEADILASAAISLPAFSFRSRQLHHENPSSYPEHAGVEEYRGFIRFIVGADKGIPPHFRSPLAKEMFEPVMQALYT